MSAPRSALDRPCPTCGSERRSALHHQKFQEPEEGGLLKEYTVCVCRTCGFAYADGVPPQEVLDRYYRERSKYEYAAMEGRESQEDRLRFESVADLVERVFPGKDHRILEIGASTGGFLATLKARGFNNLVGLDPSPACGEAAWRLYGVQVENLTIEELAREQAPFDLVVALAVLEHVRDLLGFLDAMQAPLKADGAILVQVPDVQRFSDFTAAPFQEFSTEHINYFSVQSLKNLFLRKGMKEEVVAQDVVKQSHGSKTPVINGLYRTGQGVPALQRDEISSASIETYVKKSQAIDARIRSILSGVREQRKTILVWGVGTHTQRLLAEGALDGISIKAFVDSNPHLQGNNLAGKPVLAPGALIDIDEPILISSQVFQWEIVKTIREQLKLSNNLITLYE